MKTILLVISLTLCALVVVSHITFNYGNYPIIRYDCSIAEFSPDYPIEIKKECRKLRNKT